MKTIVIVDDDKLLLRLISTMVEMAFRPEEVKIHAYYSHEAARSIIESKMVDVVFTDLMSGDVPDGYETANLVHQVNKSRDKKTLVFGVSGTLDPDILKHWRVEARLQKPFAAQNLIRLLTEWNLIQEPVISQV